MGIWSTFVRGVGEGWAWFWAPWRAVCAVLNRLTGAAQRITGLEAQLSDWSEFVVICKDCGQADARRYSRQTACEGCIRHQEFELEQVRDEELDRLKVWRESHCNACGDETGPGVIACSCE